MCVFYYKKKKKNAFPIYILYSSNELVYKYVRIINNLYKCIFEQNNYVKFIAEFHLSIDIIDYIV